MTRRQLLDLDNFDSFLNQIIFEGSFDEQLKGEIETSERVYLGINKSMLFFGSRGSIFVYHYEDMDLMSISINLTGIPKLWNIIPRKWYEVVDKITFANQVRLKNKCQMPLRHKNILIPPSVLRDYGVENYLIVQEKGMAVVTFSKVGHQGINMGFNIAEAAFLPTESLSPSINVEIHVSGVSHGFS